MNEGHFLMVNKATREIIRRPRGKEDPQHLRGQPLPNLDSLLNLSGAPEYRGEKDQLQQYRFREKKGDIEQTDLYFSVVTGLVREITYVHRDRRLPSMAAKLAHNVGLVTHLDEDILPVLTTLGTVGTDVHDLVDTVQDMRQLVKGFPGSRLFRRRGAEEIAEDDAREDETQASAGS